MNLFKNVKNIALVAVTLGAGVAFTTSSASATNTASSSSSSSIFSGVSSTSSQASGNTSATFSVKAGDGNDNDGNPSTGDGLKLTSAPSFGFGQISVGQIMNNNSNKGVAATSISNPLTVEDYRGAVSTTDAQSSRDWNVQALMSDFKDQTNSNDKSISATIGGVSASGAALSNTTIGTSNTPILASKTNGTNGTKAVTANVTSATLNFNTATSNSPITNHRYQSTIVWTLQNTAAQN